MINEKDVINKRGAYWYNRMRLLEGIKKDGNRLPISVLCKDIFSVGASLVKITNEMEVRGFIIKEKNVYIINTYITPKGEELLKILKQLNEVYGNEI